MNNIKYIKGNEDYLDLIRPLWEKLNKHHKKNSIHFKHKFFKFNFTIRIEKLKEKIKNGDLKVTIAKDINKNIIVGYSISSLSKDIGEIESIYVEPEYRGNNIGDYFMKSSIEWFEKSKVRHIQIGVITGNEEVFSFYERYGFYPKVTILSKK